MDNAIKILIVEGEPNSSGLLKTILSSSRHEAICAASGKMAISMAALNNPDLILLDLSLPDIDGMKVLRSIREWSDTPIIIVSAREGEDDKVAALDAGANDYITKPFGHNELMARIRTVLRLYKRFNAAKAESSDEPFVVGGLVIDYNKRAVTKDHRIVHLTPIEYKIVVLLSVNAGKVLTHDFIIRQIWGPYESDSQVLRVNIANIRHKLEDNPADPQYILTEVRVGYKMAEPGHEL